VSALSSLSGSPRGQPRETRCCVACLPKLEAAIASGVSWPSVLQPLAVPRPSFGARLGLSLRAGYEQAEKESCRLRLLLSPRPLTLARLLALLLQDQPTSGCMLIVPGQSYDNFTTTSGACLFLFPSAVCGCGSCTLRAAWRCSKKGRETCTDWNRRRQTATLCPLAPATDIKSVCALASAAVYQYYATCPVTLPDPDGPPGGCPANTYPMRFDSDPSPPSLSPGHAQSTRSLGRSPASFLFTSAAAVNCQSTEGQASNFQCIYRLLTRRLFVGGAASRYSCSSSLPKPQFLTQL
jgi:hypothetical protein